MGGALLIEGPLSAFGSDFWNSKAPETWSAEEIDKLVTDSPWAKEVGASFQGNERNGSGIGGGIPSSGGGGIGQPRIGVGGIGIPGIPGVGGGRGGMGGGRGRGGSRLQQYKGTVRWESAEPVLLALKIQLPETFDKHYVIAVNGFPRPGSPLWRRGDEPEDTQSTADMLDTLKAVTYLQSKGKDAAQPGVVEQQPSSLGASLLFGFSKELLPLDLDDHEVKFSTTLGPLEIKTHFNLKDMMYHRKLAV